MELTGIVDIAIEVVALKYRQDFVTNSSSSSFIFARREGCTVEEIKVELLKHLKDIEFSPYQLEDFGSKEECLNEFAHWLYGMAGGFNSIKLDDWFVSAVECCGEDDEFYGIAYYLGYLATENFRLG